MRKISRFYQTAIMQNLGLFIALGLLNILFSQYGWFPNSYLQGCITVLQQMILPVFIAYSCGRQSGDEIGAAVSVVAMLGIIVKKDTYSIFAAMVIAPVLGMLSKKLFEKIKSKIPAGFEMLARNLFVGIVGIAALVLVRSVVVVGVNHLYAAVYFISDYIVSHNMMPLLPVIIEPLKVLFLNNSINHGVLTPVGIQQMNRFGESLFFLVETNPGPGLGILLALLIKHKEERKKYAAYAMVESIGGIHEIYFPYVLARPSLIFAAIAGGVSGMFIFALTEAGLVSVVSPGSILLMLILSAKGDVLWVLAGVSVSAIVSFGVSCVILRYAKDEKKKKEQKQMEELKEKPQYIYFVCDAGFGSSAMAASLLRKKLKKEDIQGIAVEHTSIDQIPENADIVFAQKSFEKRIQKKEAHTAYYFLESVMQDAVFETLIEKWKRL